MNITIIIRTQNIIDLTNAILYLNIIKQLVPKAFFNLFILNLNLIAPLCFNVFDLIQTNHLSIVLVVEIK